MSARGQLADLLLGAGLVNAFPSLPAAGSEGCAKDDLIAISVQLCCPHLVIHKLESTIKNELMGEDVYRYVT